MTLDAPTSGGPRLSDSSLSPDRCSLACDTATRPTFVVTSCRSGSSPSRVAVALSKAVARCRWRSSPTRVAAALAKVTARHSLGVKPHQGRSRVDQGCWPPSRKVRFGPPCCHLADVTRPPCPRSSPHCRLGSCRPSHVSHLMPLIARCVCV